MDTDTHPKDARRLVLCFDGTGNRFHGTESDTNVVKLYEMLDRSDKSQMAYYQPGIGTFSPDYHGGALGFFGGLAATIEQTVDQAVGFSFGYHVRKGYEFLMEHYTQGDYIYIFGFSRGSYTARFLAEMIDNVGLLSSGNYELVRFAYATFSEVKRAKGKAKLSKKDKERQVYIERFKSAFCRGGVQTYCLGLFDCVNSVGSFEIPFWRQSYTYIGTPPAKHIRHAVSIHERRLKFKPALFRYDGDVAEDKDLKEVWFCGNHSDVGGGYGGDGTKHLLSDTPLAWMIDEILAIDDVPEAKLRLQATTVREQGHLKAGHENAAGSRDPNCAHSLQPPHDTLAFGRGNSWPMTMFWWVFEVFPFFNRLELKSGKWMNTYWPPNMGAWRDLPKDAILHSSVKEMYEAGMISEMPKLGGYEPSIL